MSCETPSDEVLYRECTPNRVPRPRPATSTSPATAQREVIPARPRVDPPTCTTGIIHRRIRSRACQDLNSCAQGFLSLPAVSSLTVLLSAACLLGGTWGLLAPTLGDATLVVGRFEASASIAFYLMALFGCSWLLLRWQRGNPDAIGPAVVGAALLPGLGITIDLIAPDRPLGAGLLAVGGLSLGLGLWRAWCHATIGRLPLPEREGLAPAMLLLLAWNIVWPVLLGIFSADEARHLTAGHSWSGPHAFSLWLPGWLLGLLAGVLLLRAAACGPNPWLEGSDPFLLKPGMRWVLALTLLAASSLHQWDLAHTAGLDLVLGDGLAPISLLVLTLNELRAHTAQRRIGRDLLLVSALSLTGVVLAACGVQSPQLDDERIPRLVSFIRCELLGPAPVLAATAAVVVWLGRRRRSTAMAWAGGIPLVAAGFIWHAAPSFIGLNWSIGTCLLALILGSWACWNERRDAALIALLLLHAGCIFSTGVCEALQRIPLSPLALLGALYPLTLLTTAICMPLLLPPRLMRWCAWIFLLSSATCLNNVELSHLQSIVGEAACAGILAATSWRSRDWLIALPICLPTTILLVRLAPENKAWFAVWAAFVLLGAALALGWRRIKAAGGTAAR